MTTQTPDVGLATAADVAHLVRSSERTVQRRVAMGEYPAHRVGRLLRFTPEDVEQILGGIPLATVARASGLGSGGGQPLAGTGS